MKFGTRTRISFQMKTGVTSFRNYLSILVRERNVVSASCKQRWYELVPEWKSLRYQVNSSSYNLIWWQPSDLPVLSFGKVRFIATDAFWCRSPSAFIFILNLRLLNAQLFPSGTAMHSRARLILFDIIVLFVRTLKIKIGWWILKQIHWA